MDARSLLKTGVKAALLAGEEILRIYLTDFHVETKSDNTPVTTADKASGAIIARELAVTNIPLISEEDTIAPYEVRKHWDKVWLIDPLDGTKEYVKRNGEFAVNIALVENNLPTIGIIYSPILKQIYFGAKGLGSFRITWNTNITELTPEAIANSLFEYGRPLPLQITPAIYTMVASRSHLSREINDYLDKLKRMYGEVSLINAGSSIKQCWVAEGKAHEYPRFGKTMEWDTAAGQCILEEAGAALLHFETGLPLTYNKEDLQNPYFVAKRL